MAILMPLAQTNTMNDWSGEVSCEWESHSRRGLMGFLQSMGLDTRRYYPIGINIYREGGELVSVFAVEARTAREAAQLVLPNGEVFATRFLPRATTAQVLSHMHRFSLNLRNNLPGVGDLRINFDEDSAVKLQA
jgi:hypothetical protein